MAAARPLRSLSWFVRWAVTCIVWQLLVLFHVIGLAIERRRYQFE